jgi:hypothetical protein
MPERPNIVIGLPLISEKRCPIARGGRDRIAKCASQIGVAVYPIKVEHDHQIEAPAALNAASHL